MHEAEQSLDVKRNPARRSIIHARGPPSPGSPDQADAGISDFQGQRRPWVKDHGGRGGILLIDLETSKAIAVTLWNDAESMRSSEDRRTSFAARCPA